MKYDTWFSEHARIALLALSDAAFEKVSDAIELLSTYPDLGRAYDPYYETAQAPVSLRVMYAGNYGISYTPDHARQIIRVHYVEDQRMDPRTRFSGRL